MDTESVDRVRARIEKLQKYLGSVVEYQGQRDQAIADWLQRTLGQAQQLIRDEAERVIADLAAQLDRVSEDAEGKFQERIEEQSRSLAYTLSVQEARIRISLMEGQSEQADALMKQLEALEELEKDLTLAFDERMAKLAEIIASATIWSVEEIAGRVRKESTKVFQEGMEDLVALIDRRFVWLEHSIDERLKKLEKAAGVTTRIPEAKEKPAASSGRPGELPLSLEDEVRARF
jgi:metal-responsive CopG/Arc/MetJ family transcriptional regulator